MISPVSPKFISTLPSLDSPFYFSPLPISSFSTLSNASVSSSTLHNQPVLPFAIYSNAVRRMIKPPPFKFTSFLKSFISRASSFFSTSTPTFSPTPTPKRSKGVYSLNDFSSKPTPSLGPSLTGGIVYMTINETFTINATLSPTSTTNLTFTPSLNV